MCANLWLRNAYWTPPHQGKILPPTHTPGQNHTHTHTAANLGQQPPPPPLWEFFLSPHPQNDKKLTIFKDKLVKILKHFLKAPKNSKNVPFQLKSLILTQKFTYTSLLGFFWFSFYFWSHMKVIWVSGKKLDPHQKAVLNYPPPSSHTAETPCPSMAASLDITQKS